MSSSFAAAAISPSSGSGASVSASAAVSAGNGSGGSNGLQPQQYCLRWNNHQHNLLSVFEDLLHNEAFVDVTLACDGLQVS